MRRLRGDARGLSEIVGTLLLVVIVVGAAAAFSLFVASYESQVEAEEAAAHDRALEDIRVLSVSTVLSPGNASYSNLSFVAGSLDVNTMTVNELTINGQFINYYTVTPLGSSTSLAVCALCGASMGTVQEFNLTSLEQVTIAVNLTVWNALSNPHGGFFTPYEIATTGSTDYVSISLYTTLGNDFSRVFDPPTAIALTEQSQVYSNGSYVNAVLFDGSQSIVPANDTIVAWSWSIRAVGIISNYTTLSPFGEKVLFPVSSFPKGTYTATLIVADSNGLSGTAAVTYVSP